MSRSSQSHTRIVCPECDATVPAPIPGPQPIDRPGSDRPRLRGTETDCRNCERELEIYYY